MYLKCVCLNAKERWNRTEISNNSKLWSCKGWLPQIKADIDSLRRKQHMENISRSLRNANHNDYATNDRTTTEQKPRKTRKQIAYDASKRLIGHGRQFDNVLKASRRKIATKPWVSECRDRWNLPNKHKERPTQAWVTGWPKSMWSVDQTMNWCDGKSRLVRRGKPTRQIAWKKLETQGKKLLTKTVPESRLHQRNVEKKATETKKTKKHVIGWPNDEMVWQ